MVSFLGLMALAEAAHKSQAEQLLQDGTTVLARISEAIGAIIIAVGVVKAMINWIRQSTVGFNPPMTTESIRLGLGRALGLALEFLLAADILSTAVAPTWNDIAQLAAIAAIRTGLNYFLGKELKQEELRRQMEPLPEQERERKLVQGKVTTD